VWVATAVLGLALFRWLPLTSTFLWWGAGALVIASVAAGGAVDKSDYDYVSESDFSTLYYYDSSYSGYYELEQDSSASVLFEEDYDGEYTRAEGRSRLRLHRARQHRDPRRSRPCPQRAVPGPGAEPSTPLAPRGGLWPHPGRSGSRLAGPR
jgi:hypothetical protein